MHFINNDYVANWNWFSDKFVNCFTVVLIEEGAYELASETAAYPLIYIFKMYLPPYNYLLETSLVYSFGTSNAFKYLIIISR